ncbi:MAG: beta-lactamase domain protein, partial [Microgenomates group bacterium GW2011_GWE1_47_12]
LLELGGLPDIDILKVGHHGSKYASTLPFLERIKPELAIISVGKGNRYGHPTQETLERLERVGTEIARTDQEGIIEVNF